MLSSVPAPLGPGCRAPCGACTSLGSEAPVGVAIAGRGSGIPAVGTVTASFGFLAGSLLAFREQRQTILTPEYLGGSGVGGRMPPG